MSKTKIKRLNDRFKAASRTEAMTYSGNKFIKNSGAMMKQNGLSEEEIYSEINDLKKRILKIESKSEDSQLSIINPDRSANEMLSKINPDAYAALEKSKAEDIEEKNKSKVRAAENLSKENRVNVDIDPRDKEYEPISLTVNEDENSIAKISENNKKIFDRLLDMGEIQIANHVHGLMEKVKVGPKFKYASQIQENTDQLKAVSATNVEIEKHLAEVEEHLRQRQDTDIDDVDKVVLSEALNERLSDSEQPNGNEFNFGTGILDMLFGKAISLLLRTSKTLFSLGVNIVRPILGWLMKSLKGGITSLFKSLFAKPLEMLTNLNTRFTNFVGFVTNKMKAMADGVKKIISFVPGLGKAALGKIFEMPSKLSNLVPTNVKNAAKAYGEFTNKGIDLVKTGAKKVYSVGKGAIDWASGKFASIKKGIDSVASKVSSKFSGIPKRLTDHVSRTGGKVANGGIFQKMGKFTKVLKAVPFLGTAISVGFAAAAAKKGWDNAGDLYGVPQEDVTTGAKITSALGAVVKDLLWPIPINQSTIANTALALTGGSITKTGGKVEGDFKQGNLGDVSQFEEEIPTNIENNNGNFGNLENVINEVKGNPSRVESFTPVRTGNTPVNYKERKQEEIDSIILETQKLQNEENSKAIENLSTTMNNIQQSINQQNFNITNESTSKNLTNVFAINNTEYVVGDELKF